MEIFNKICNLNGNWCGDYDSYLVRRWFVVAREAALVIREVGPRFGGNFFVSVRGLLHSSCLGPPGGAPTHLVALYLD